MGRELPKTPDARARRAWPAVRALLLAVHVFAMVALSFPSAGMVGDVRRWRRPRTQREIGLWSRRLTAWGFPITHDELDRRLWAFAQRYLAVREAVAKPFRPYVAVTGAVQSWGMFRSPQRHPGELSVEIDEGEGYRLIHLSRSDDHSWRSLQLSHNRFRKQLGRFARDGVLFDQIGGWIAQQALADHPGAQRVRVRYSRFDAPPPEGPRREIPREVARELVVARQEKR